MYAVIETGGKQYTVSPNKIIQIEKLEAAVGDSINLPVLLLKRDEFPLEIGKPILSNIKVQAEVLEHNRGEKIKIMKFRRRKHHRKQMGHRQYHTLIKITNIGS